MGAMKWIATEEQMHPGTTFTRFNKDDRESIHALLRGSEAVLFAQQEMARHKAERSGPNGALASINLRLDFVGKSPTVSGRYMVFDTLTDRMRFAQVALDRGKDRWLGTPLVGTVTFETGTTMSVATVCKDTTLWFLVPPVEEDDKTLLRAVVAEADHARAKVQ